MRGRAKGLFLGPSDVDVSHEAIQLLVEGISLGLLVGLVLIPTHLLCPIEDGQGEGIDPIVLLYGALVPVDPGELVEEPAKGARVAKVCLRGSILVGSVYFPYIGR